MPRIASYRAIRKRDYTVAKPPQPKGKTKGTGVRVAIATTKRNVLRTRII